MKNTMIQQSSSLLLSLVLACGCSSLSGAGKPSASASKFQLRPFQEKTLQNGLRILYIKDDSLPRVGMHLMVQSGSAQDPAGSEGLTAFTVALLEQGTTHRNAMQIADEFAQLGSSFTEASSSNYVMMSTVGLSQTREKLLSLYSEVVLNPAFTPAEVQRKRSQILADLAQLPDQPTEFASVAFDKELFGSHPYAHPVSGTVEGIKKISRSDIIRHYFEHFRPNNSLLSITGNFDEGFQQKVESIFSQWQLSKAPNLNVPEAKPAEKVGLKLYSKAGLQQAQIRMGHLGISRRDPDYMSLRLANLILGGAFASRLNQKIRDDLGLTYSISSQLDARKATGSFEISTFARNEKVADVITNTRALVENFQKSGVTKQELDAAKALLIGQFPASIETVDRLAFNLMALRIHGIPDTYLTQFFDNVNSIGIKEVNAVISKRFHPDQLKVVVFADEKAVQSQLQQLGAYETQKVE